MMSPAPPPVTPSRKLPPRLGVPPLVAAGEPPHAANGPASITPPANTPALISRRRRVSEVALRSPGRSIGVSAIDFLLLDLRHLPETTQSAIAVPSSVLSARFTARSRRSEEHTSELQSQSNLVCRLLLEKKNNIRVTQLRVAYIYE